MANHRCPLCQKPGRLLDVGNNSPFIFSVQYYRCEPCGHVWSQSKFDPNAQAVSVTQIAPVSMRSKGA